MKERGSSTGRARGRARRRWRGFCPRCSTVGSRRWNGRRPSPSSWVPGAERRWTDVDVDAAVDADALRQPRERRRTTSGCGVATRRRAAVVPAGTSSTSSGTPRRSSSGSGSRRSSTRSASEEPGFREALQGPDGTTLLRFAQTRFPEHPEHGPEDQPTAHDIHLGTSRDGWGTHYEIMSGCLNGGGQLRRRRRRRRSRDRETAGDDGEGAGGRARDEVPMGRRHRGAAAAGWSPEVAEAYRDCEAVGSERARALFHGTGGAEAAAAAGGAVAVAAQLKLTSDW